MNNNDKSNEFKTKSLTINKNYFQFINDELQKGIYDMAEKVYDHNFEDSLRIYMPDYINIMLHNYMRSQVMVYPVDRIISLSDTIKSSKFMGVEVIDNYTNTIVIAIKNSVMNNIEPIVIPLKEI